MRTLSLLFTALLILPVQSQDLNLEDRLEQLHTEHRKLESYFASYQGTAPNGKSLTAVIAYHGEAKMAAVQAQFKLNGEVVVTPLQATTPELGMVLFDELILQMPDAETWVASLTETASALYSDESKALGNWGPVTALSRERAEVHLNIAVNRRLPWLLEDLPEGTTFREEDENLLFETPDGASYRVHSQTGLLIAQRYPNEEGERTLTLIEQKINLPAAEIEARIESLVPAETKRISIKEHPLFFQLQEQSARQVVTMVEEENLTIDGLKARLKRARIREYLEETFPNAYQLVASEEKWKKALAATEGLDDRTTLLTQKITLDWEGAKYLEAARLMPQTDAGKTAAELLANHIREAFLSLAVEQALEKF